MPLPWNSFSASLPPECVKNSSSRTYKMNLSSVTDWCLHVFQPTSIGSNTAAEGETKLGRVPSLRDFSTKALVGSLPRTKLFIVRSQLVKSALLSPLVLQTSLATGFWHLEVSEFGFEGAISVVLAWRTALLLRVSRRIRMSNTEPTLVEPGYDITLAAILLLTYGDLTISTMYQ